MKDEKDSNTIDFIAPVQAAKRIAERCSAPAGAVKSQPKRLPNQSSETPPPGAKPLFGGVLGFGVSVVPVSAVAKDWGVSARRIRIMLSTGRLDGRQNENGYWEVYYPYRYVFGTRGPGLRRQQKQERRAA